MALDFKKVDFVTTATGQEGWPRLVDAWRRPLPEIAVAGRSNVGKSSLINHLFRQKKLARTSGRPGKTQAVNFFVADDAVVFADLPGYGYAKVPHALLSAWRPMLEDYLNKREPLRLVLFLLDVRRLPSEEDLQFFEWATYYGKPLLLVITKIDKVSAAELKKATAAILDALGAEDVPYVHYSVHKSVGRRELVGAMQQMLQNEANRNEL